ncbi:MAG TPA: hypothetical protein VG389_25390 [Myxococcota bacterium]|jgi:hypothetical protein|nr:hypothetical protein [Myxococcota bacterium]
MSETGEWREAIAPGEGERFEALARALVGAGQRDGRTLHRHALAVLHARFEVAAGVPEPLRHGVCARPATYEAWVRFSSGAARAQSDRVADVRGFAVKVVGVEGAKVIPGLESAPTQDFVMIPPRTFAFSDPDAFVAVAMAAPRGAGAVFAALRKHYGFFGTLRRLPALRRAQDASPRSLAERTFHTALPIRWGPHAVKVRFRPAGVPPPVPAGAGDDVLSAEIAARARAHDLAFTVEVQRFVDERRTPIEDPTVEWREDVSPWAGVARLLIPAQDAASPRGRALADYAERLSFDPWHALAEHRPLGAIMRARGAAYRLSVEARAARSELEVVPPSAVGGA